MQDEKKTRAQLIEELRNLRKECEAARQLSSVQTPGTDVFHKIVENANDAIISINRSGFIVFANRKAEEMFGYTAGEMRGKSSAELIPQESRDAEERALSRYRLNLQGGFLNTLQEGLIMCKNGTLLPVEASYYGYQLDGEYFMTGILRDISERKQMEQAIEESRDFLKLLFNIGLEGLIVSDAQGNITMVNDRAAEMLAYAKHDLIGKHFGNLGLTQAHDQEQARVIIEGFLQHGMLRGVERTWIRGDGKRIDVEMNIATLKDPAGNSIGAMASLRDISLRKQADMAIRTSEERYRRIFESAFVAIQEEDISPLMSAINELKSAGVKMRTYLTEHPEFIDAAIGMATITDVNAASLKLYGAKDKEELLHSMDKILREESLPALREALIALAEGKSFFQTETIHYTLHGEQKNVLLQGNFIIKQRDLNRVLISIIDITHIKSVEKKLLEYQQQLRSLTNELSTKEENERRNLGMYLHDRIGQSLSAVKMQLEMMTSELASGDGREKLSQSIQLLEKTIHDTRVLSYELSPVILHELGLDVALGWLVEQMQKQHNLAVSFKSDNKAKQLNDDLKIILYRAVSELMNNAVKHAWAQHVAVSIRRRNGQVQITVEDDGVGFDPAELEGIAATEHGFGLFSIKERLHYLGGSIRIKSAPYKGTRITLFAPLKDSSRSRSGLVE